MFSAEKKCNLLWKGLNEQTIDQRSRYKEFEKKKLKTGYIKKGQWASANQ